MGWKKMAPNRWQPEHIFTKIAAAFIRHLCDYTQIGQVNYQHNNDATWASVTDNSTIFSTASQANNRGNIKALPASTRTPLVSDGHPSQKPSNAGSVSVSCIMKKHYLCNLPVKHHITDCIVPEHVETETKWLPYCRRHCPMHYLSWTFLIFE